MLARSVVPILLGVAIGGVGVGASAASPPAHIATPIYPTPPGTIRAKLISRPAGTFAPGTGLSGSRIDNPVTFVGGEDGFALATVGQTLYPAATSNGGYAWNTSGPALQVNPAQKSLTVNTVGALSATTYYYSGGGQVVDVTSDGGRHWWRASLGELVLAVFPGSQGQLVAVVQRQIDQTSQTAFTWLYASNNGGRVWHYVNNIGALYVPRTL
jgi:hypothetical protein